MSVKVSVIIGPPGTGKTSTISRWCAQAAAKWGHDRVLVCSLTRAGAKQAAREIELPAQQIGTAHAFAHRALGSPTMAESKVKEWNEAYPDMALSSHSATVDNAYDLHDDVTDADRAKLEVARLRTFGLDPRLAVNAVTSGFHTKWEDWKKQCGFLDFVDLIERATFDVERAPGDPAIIMNDEAQDTGMLEMQLLLKWAKHAEHFVVVGDSQQSIFSWRGSDPLLIQRLWQEHDATREPLQQSYRLSKAVYATAYEWAGRFTQTMRVAFKPRESEGEVIHTSQTFEKVTAQQVEQMVHAYDDGSETEYVPVMFLASCGYMLDPIIKALREAGIAFFNPWRPNHGGWNPLPQKRSKGFTVLDRVLAFLRPSVDVWGEYARFWTAQDVRAWAGGLPATDIFSRGGVQAIQALSDTAKDTEIAVAFCRWFLPEAREHMVPTPDVNWYLSQVKGSDRLRDFVNAVIVKQGAARLRDKPRVCVGTVHSLKGSEAMTIILAPDVSVQSYDAARAREDVAEELRRVFYVGLTRARERLVLCGPSRKWSVRW